MTPPHTAHATNVQRRSRAAGRGLGPRARSSAALRFTLSLSSTLDSRRGMRKGPTPQDRARIIPRKTSEERLELRPQHECGNTRHPHATHTNGPREAQTGSERTGSEASRACASLAASSPLNSVLVRAGLGDVAHPFDGLVIRLLEHLEEAHVQPRRGEHGHLEVHDDRRA